MSNIVKHSLFPTDVYKVRIDSDRYDKESLVNKMLLNYKIAPYRNNWDSVSVLHHTYNDGSNNQFYPVDCADLMLIYEEVLVDLVKELSLDRPLNFRFQLSNVAINTEYMQQHDHGSSDINFQCVFSCVHYVKYKKNQHPNTTLVNPIKLYDDSPLSNKYGNALNKNIAASSSYYPNWEVDVEEDDLLIFPSYLEHYVKAKTGTDFSYPRIIVSINIDVY